MRDVAREPLENYRDDEVTLAEDNIEKLYKNRSGE